MFPAASVSGWYFSHPESNYFGIGNIGEDQVRRLADIREEELSIIKKYLSPNLE